MKYLRAETEANFESFTAAWKRDMSSTAEAIEATSPDFLSSYRRIVTLQAWRSEILEKKIPHDALAFFLEAQNDALVSHVSAHFGSWRSALKALRSCIENVMFCLYYADHPVELSLWKEGRHKLGFAHLEDYFSKHPAFRNVSDTLTGLPTLQKEYSTLSKAVHASALSFRMTADARKITLFISDKKNFGEWNTRESLTIYGINLLLLTHFHTALHGNALPSLRKTLSLVMRPSSYAAMKKTFGITLYDD